MKRLKLLLLATCIATTLTACGTTSTITSEEQTIAEENPTENSEISDEKTIYLDMTPLEAHGKLTLNGAKIVDANNTPFQIKGVSTHGIAWFPQYVNAEAFATIQNDWGGNCIRLAMYSDENMGYCSGGNKEKLKQLVKDGVQYATDLGMYVIIDWHVLGEHDPNVHKDEAKLFFEEMSSLYADYDNVLYEICNEPNGNVNWSSIKKYAEEIIPAIRKNDSDALIIVGTPNWSQDVDLAAKDPIKGYDNILYTIHFYADTHKEDLRRKVRNALDANLPLFCSEFGICDASGNGQCNQVEANKWISFFDDNNISYCIWALSNKNESCALIKSNCSKTSSWSEDELSEQGQWYLGVLGGTGNSDDSGSSTGSGSDDANNSADSGSDDANNSTGSDSADADSSTGASDSTTSSDNADNSNANDTNAVVNINATNSWNDGSKDFVQYDISISNNTSDMNNWTVTVEFVEDVDIDQNWNCNYEISGKNITITPVDYNSTINKGSSISGVGLIVKSNKEIKVKKISIK